MCRVIKCRIADATHMKVNTLFFADNDDDNDDIGDGDDYVGEDIDDIDDGSCSCGQVELMQKGTNSDADNEEPFHNDIGQSSDRHVKKHCNTMNIYFMSSYIHHNHCAYCDQGQIDCSIEQRKMKSL